MKTETWRTLVMDPELGQLPPEVKELLDAYLEAAPAARAEAEATARAAAMIALAALAGGLGYRLGQANASAKKPSTTAPTADPRFQGLWTRYQVAYDTRRGTYVIAQE